MNGTHAWWYLARATGLVSWGLLTASVLWGFIVATRLFRKGPSPAWYLDLHRFLGGAAVAFTAIHVGTMVADGTVHFGVKEILVPLSARWHPVAVAWGVIALYLLVAVELTSLAMRRLPRKVWRAIHRSGAVLYVTATIHALTAGTDARADRMAWWAALIASLLVLFGLLVRVLSPRGTKRAAKDGATAARVPHASPPPRAQQAPAPPTPVL